MKIDYIRESDGGLIHSDECDNCIIPKKDNIVLLEGVLYSVTYSWLHSEDTIGVIISDGIQVGSHL